MKVLHELMSILQTFKFKIQKFKFQSVLICVVVLFAGDAIGTQKQVILTFLYVNGTLVPVVQNTTETSASNTGPLIASIFLILLSLISCVASMIVIGTIASSLALRRLPINILLLNIAVFCIVENVNILASAAYLLTRPWQFGVYPCNVNSYFMEFIPILYTLLLLTINLDRVVALRNPRSYRKNLSVARQRCYIVLYWILCLAVPAVIAAGLLKSWPFPDRYSCQIMDTNSIYYGVVILAVCFCLPWLILLGTLFVIRQIISMEKKNEKKEQRGINQPPKLSEPDVFNMANNTRFLDESKVMVLIFTLDLIYTILMVPYILRIKSDQIAQGYNYAYYNNLTMAHYPDTTSPTTTGDALTTQESETTTSTTNYTVRDQSMVPEVEEDNLGTMDTVFIWMRYVHAALVPILIFVLHKDLRKKAEILLICWRPNSVETKHRQQHISPFIQTEDQPVSNYIQKKKLEWEKKQKKFKNVTNYSLPVLFASSDGLYLRMVDNHVSSGSTNSLNNLNDSIKAQWTVDPKFIMVPCDVYLPGSANPQYRRKPDFDDGFGTTITVFERKKQSRSVTKHVDEDEGFVDTSSNSNEHVPLIAIDQDEKRGKKLSRHPNEKRVTFQREVSEFTLDENQEEESPRKEEHKKRHQQLSPLPPKPESDHKRKKISSTRDSPPKRRRSDHHHHSKESSSKKSSHSKKDDDRKRSKSRQSRRHDVVDDTPV